MQHVSIATAAATVSADFNANTLATIAGGAGGFTPGFKCEVEKLRFRVGDADFAGAGGTLTFELRKDSATGTALAQLVIPLASALRGVTLEAAVSAANAELAKLSDTSKLFLVRLATGTVFTTASGTFEVLARQLPQARQ
jgi:hypothetical protein